jgi:predicted TIM-barrel fold metal-dependent hydrolase
MAGVVDIDSHVFEPAAIWDDYVPSGERARATRAFHHSLDGEGNEATILNGRPARSLNRSKIVRQAVWRPGMRPEDIGSLDPHIFHPLNPGAADPKARLADLDLMGIAHQVVFPSLFGEYLPQVADPEAAVVLARAYNDWVADFAAAGDGRLHAVAILPMQSPDLASAELERVAARGLGAVMIRPSFYQLEAEGFGLMPVDPAAANMARPFFVEDKPFRPVWEKADELGLVACVHPYLGITGPETISSGGFTERVSARLPVQHTVTEPIAYIQDADLFVTAVLFHGLLEDLPGLKLAVVHAGCTWVPLALEKCETFLWIGEGGFPSVPVCLNPEEVWERHPLLVSFDSWEKSVARIPGVLGGKAAWGSRYPHHDASEPAEATAMLAEHNVDEATVAALMGGHARALFGLDFDPGG